MDDIFRSQFRLPYPLYEKLKEEAENANRSLNAEIVARLQASVEQPRLGFGPGSEGVRQMEEAAERIAESALQRVLERSGVMARQTGRGKVGPKKPT